MSLVVVIHNKTELLRGQLTMVGGQKHNGKWYDVFAVTSTEGHDLKVMMERDVRDELLVTWEAYNAAR